MPVKKEYSAATSEFWAKQKQIIIGRKKPKEKITGKEPDTSLRMSVFEGSFQAVMEAFTRNFISPFALALNAGNNFISLITTLPGLIASFGQLIVPWLLRVYPKRKFWAVSGALFQGLSWLPIAFLPYYTSSLSLPILLLLVTLASFFSAIINPLWNSLMGDIVPQESRGAYFGKRNLVCGGVSFVSTFVVGIILNMASESLSVYAAFAVVFTSAFISRMISSYYLSRMYEPQIKLSKKDNFTLLQFVRTLRKTDYGKYVIYLCLIGFAVNIASPFYAVYMLNDLKFSYLQFTIITMSSIVSGLATVFLWGRYADRLGNKNILLASGILIFFAPVVWFLTTEIKTLIIAEVFSGVVWAGFNLAAANYTYDATSPEKRPRCIAYFNVLNGSCVFLGAILGGIMSKYLPAFWFTSSIPLLFIISALLRLAVTLFFFNKLREARLVELSLPHSSIFIGRLIINPRQALSYNHSMGVSEQKVMEPLFVSRKPKRRDDPLKPMKKEEVKRGRFFINQYFRVTKNEMLSLEKEELRTKINRK